MMRSSIGLLAAVLAGGQRAAHARASLHAVGHLSARSLPHRVCACTRSLRTSGKHPTTPPPTQRAVPAPARLLQQVSMSLEPLGA